MIPSTLQEVVIPPAKPLKGFAKMAATDPIKHRHAASLGGQISARDGLGFRLNPETSAIQKAMIEAKANKDKLALARLRYEMQLYIHGLVGFISVFDRPDANIVAKAKKAKKPATKPADKTSVPAKKGAGTPKKTGKNK